MSKRFRVGRNGTRAKDNMYTTLMKQKIIQPAYRIYLSSSDSVLQAIQQALIYPARLLYLGESDDMVEIHGVHMQQAEPIFTKQIVSAVPVEDCQENEVVNRDVSICQWPVRFQEGKRSQYHLTYQLVYSRKRDHLCRTGSMPPLIANQRCNYLKEYP